MAKSHSIAQAKYDSTHCKYYTLKMNLVNDADIISQLATQDSMQGYIKQLIRDDITRTRTDSVSESKSETWEELINKRIMNQLIKNNIIIRTQFNTDTFETIFEAFQDESLIETLKYPGDISFKDCFNDFSKKVFKLL